MEELTRKKLEAVAMVIYLFIATVTTAGAISTMEVVHIIAGILNLVCAGLVVYKRVINNA